MGKQWKPGESGNPNGRPPGTTLAGRLREAVGREFDGIVEALIASAKGGDIQAANLLLTRVCPALKPISEPTKLEIAGDSLTEKSHSILGLVSDGKLSAPDAKLVIDGLSAVARITETDDLLRRIELLEGKVK